jgi:hypothetical protein
MQTKCHYSMGLTLQDLLALLEVVTLTKMYIEGAVLLANPSQCLTLGMGICMAFGSLALVTKLTYIGM